MRGGPHSSLTSLILALLWPVAIAFAAEPQKQANRLAKETSPYLLQHAHNPVDWYPVGRRGAGEGEKGREGDISFRRLFELPLVPCDGAGKL